MAMEAGDLIATLHGKCLRLSVDILGQHKQGLSAAARQLHLGKKIGANLKRKMIHLDLAYHVSRHITTSSVEEFYEKLRYELSEEVAEKVSESVDFDESPTDDSCSPFVCMSESGSEPYGNGLDIVEPDPVDMPTMKQLPGCLPHVKETLDRWLYDGIPSQGQYTSDSQCPISYFIGDHDSGAQMCEQGVQTDMSIHHDASIVIPSPLQAVMMGLHSLDMCALQQITAVLKDHEGVMRSSYEVVRMPKPNGTVLDQTAYLDHIVHSDESLSGGSCIKSLLSDTKYNGLLVVRSFFAWWKAYRQPSQQVYEPTWMHTLPAISQPSPLVNWSSFGALGHGRQASKLGAKIVEQLRKARQVEQDGDDTMCSPEAKPTEMASCSKCARACSCIECERAVLVARRLVIDKGKLCKCGDALAVCRQAPIAWVCLQCGASLGRVSAGFPRCEHVLCFSCI